MSIRGIIIDSLSYPFSNWMRFLFLGIVVLISFSQYAFLSLVKINFLLFICLDIIGFLFVGSFARGYLFKIINKSLTGINELPGFNDWINIFIDGIKVLIVNIIYLFPFILITLSLIPPANEAAGRHRRWKPPWRWAPVHRSSRHLSTRCRIGQKGCRPL